MLLRIEDECGLTSMCLYRLGHCRAEVDVATADVSCLRERRVRTYLTLPPERLCYTSSYRKSLTGSDVRLKLGSSSNAVFTWRLCHQRYLIGNQLYPTIWDATKRLHM